MTYAVPLVDLEDVQLDAVRAGTQDLGALQVVNHGVDAELSEDLGRRMARLLSLPRAEKARLASPHPYRGWRQWPDDFGRLELERFNVAQFDSVADAQAAGVPEEYLGLYAHANVWPGDDPGLRETALAYMTACRGLAERMLRLYGRCLGVGEDAFALGGLPHFRLTVNEYPTWTYPESAAATTSCCCSSTRTTRRSPSWPSRVTTRDCRSRRRTGRGSRCLWCRVPCRCSPGRCSRGGPTGGCARRGTGWWRAAP